MGTVSKTGVFNADGTDGGLTHGLGTAPDNAVYVSGPNDLDEGKAEGAITPGGALIAGTNDGEVAAAGAAQVGPFKGIAHENDLKADDGTVLDAYAAAARVPFYFKEGLIFAATAAGVIAEDAEVECAATHGQYQAVSTGTPVGRLIGKKAAAANDRILIYYYGGQA